jgi:hypothetical protein
MSDIREQDAALNEKILAGNILEAFEAHYDDGCAMQENDDPPTVGKAANRAREEQFVGSIEQVHELALLSSAVGNDNVSYSTWRMDVTFKDGNRAAYTQVAVREWKDGKVAREQFFHG